MADVEFTVPGNGSVTVSGVKGIMILYIKAEPGSPLLMVTNVKSNERTVSFLNDSWWKKYITITYDNEWIFENSRTTGFTLCIRYV